MYREQSYVKLAASVIFIVTYTSSCLQPSFVLAIYCTPSCKFFAPNCFAMMTTIGLERMSSIECEPLTLSFAELQLAREAAMYILNNNPLEEAVKIFTEGLQPVPMMRDNVRLSEGSESGEEEEEEDDDVDDDEVLMDYFGMNHRFSPPPCHLRDKVTAPF